MNMKPISIDAFKLNCAVFLFSCVFPKYSRKYNHKSFMRLIWNIYEFLSPNVVSLAVIWFRIIFSVFSALSLFFSTYLSSRRLIKGYACVFCVSLWKNNHSHSIAIIRTTHIWSGLAQVTGFHRVFGAVMNIHMRVCEFVLIL